MSKHPTLIQQFRSFYFQNNPKDFEQAIEYFSVFGGMGWSVDMDKPLLELVETKLLKNYAYIHGDITKLTNSNKLIHALLSAIAVGDRRMFSSFKRARVSREEGDEAVDKLYESGLIDIEYSLELPLKEEDHNSDKLNFVKPFMRFWFRLFTKRSKRVIIKKTKSAFPIVSKGLMTLYLKNFPKNCSKKVFKMTLFWKLEVIGIKMQR